MDEGWRNGIEFRGVHLRWIEVQRAGEQAERPKDGADALIVGSVRCPCGRIPGMKRGRIGGWRYGWNAILLIGALVPGLRAQAPSGKIRSDLDTFQHEKRYAVVVGINQYVPGTFPALQFAVADADAMRKTLSGPAEKFDVDEVTAFTATTENIKEHLHTAASAAEEDATLLFYFAGHGGEVNGRQYLASYEVSPKALERGLSIDEVRDEMQRSKARRKILLIDACRADVESGATRGVLVQRFGVLPSAAGLEILNATGEKQSSYEEPQFGHGVFTQYVVRGLNGEAADENGLIYFGGLARYVEDNVRTWVRKRFGALQDPKFSAIDVNQDFLLGGSFKAAQAPAPAAPTGDAVEDAFRRAHAAGANRLQMLRAFTLLFPKSEFAPLAEYDAAAYDPQPEKAFFDLGLKFMDMGEHPMAIAAFSKAVDANPGNTAAAGYRALELSYDLALNDAIVEATNVLKRQPGNIAALLGRGMAYFRFNMMEPSKADLARVTASTPTDARGYHFRADAWYFLNEFDKSIADFTKALQLRPDYGVSYNDRGNTYQSKQDPAHAIADYTEALRILPNNPVIWSNRGVENWIAGNADAAFQDLAEALRLRPTYAWAFWQRGSMFLALKKYPEAVRDFTAALQQSGFVYAPGALIGRGMAHLGAGEYSEAASDFTEFIRLLPEAPDGFEQRALAREKLGDHAGAEADRAQAARLKK